MKYRILNSRHRRVLRIALSSFSIGLLVQLKNAVYKELFRLLEQGISATEAPAYVQKEPVEFIRSAHEKWEGRLKLAINRLCSNYNVVLARLVCV